jgi:hypothetical protein
MPEFPIVLLPHAITQIQSELPPIPLSPPLPKVPEAPKKPPKPLRAKPERIEWGVFTITALVATIFLVIAAVLNPSQSLPLALLATPSGGILGIIIISQLFSFPVRQQNYEQEHVVQLSQYKKTSERLLSPNLREAYHRKGASLKKEHHTPENIAKYRQRKCLMFLSKTTRPDRTDSEAKQGSSERDFAKDLKRFFPGKIHTGQAFDIPGFLHPYTADFAYIDEASGLHIDIEIDEPYDYKSSDPIHYIDSTKDNERNEFFRERGWLVIRFSEKQVVRYPQSCCKKIATLVAEVTGDVSGASKFQNVQDLKPEPQWTQAKAVQMAKDRTRDKYKLG